MSGPEPWRVRLLRARAVEPRPGVSVNVDGAGALEVRDCSAAAGAFTGRFIEAAIVPLDNLDMSRHRLDLLRALRVRLLQLATRDYAGWLCCEGFWATAPGTVERMAEERWAADNDLTLRELKPIEAAALAYLAGLGGLPSHGG